jgi:hypothetical protein
MKKIIISLLIILSILIVGYIFKDISVTESEAYTDDRFVKIQSWGNNFVMVDKETGVQYYAFSIAYGGGGITVLVDADGKPLLYEED